MKGGLGRASRRAGFVQRISNSWLIYLIAFAVFALIALVVFYPTTTHILTNVPSAPNSDLYYSLWNFWEVDYSIFTLHQGIWHTNLIFWPEGANLVFRVATPLTSILAYPIMLVSLPLAYNVVFFLSIAFSAFGMFLLSDYLIKDKSAAFVSGIAFGFCAFHIAAAYPDFAFANVGWIPICVYFLLRMLNRDYLHFKHGKYLTAFGLAASISLMYYTSHTEQVVFTLMTLLVISLYYLIGSKNRKLVLSREFLALIGLSVVFFALINSFTIFSIGSGFFAGGGSAALNQPNTIPNNIIWSDNLLYYFTPSFYNGLFNPLGRWNSAYGSSVELDTAYIGFATLVLAVMGIYGYGRKLGLWVGLCIIFLLFSLGPYIQIGKINTGIPGPYLLLKYVPVFLLVKEPGRYALLVSLGLAVMAGYGAKFLFSKLKIRNGQVLKLAVLAAIALVLLIDLATPPLTAAFAANTTINISGSPFYTALGRQSGNFAVLELPALNDPQLFDTVFYPSMNMFSTIYSHKPIVGGYLGRPNQEEDYSGYDIPLAVQATEIEEGQNPVYLSPIEENYTEQTILLMRLDNISYVTVDKSAFDPYGLDSIEHYLASVFGNPIYEDNSIIAFSTANAVDRPSYDGFVGYPELAYWNITVYDQRYFWVPNRNGTIDVYAPYLQSNVSAGGGQETTVKLTAVALGRQSAILKISDGNSGVASFDLTATPQDYSFDIMLAAGNQLNKLHFASGGNYLIGISNVSFSLESADT